MGWLWTSDSSAATKQSATPTSSGALERLTTAPAPNTPVAAQPQSPSWGLSEEQRMRIFGRPSPIKPSSTEASQQSDAEVEAFLRSLEEPDPSKAQPAPKAPVVKHTAPAKEEPREIDRVRPDGSLDISLDVMYPRTMSCREAFDELYYCHSLGGKFNDIYRYGESQSCSEQWDAWVFCMRTRLQAEKDKQPQIRDFYAAREAARKKKHGSSEDIWEARDTAVQKAFWRPHPEKLAHVMETKE